MGVFKRWHEHKDGSKTAYWYIRYWINGKEKKEAVGRVGAATKTQAQARLEDRRRQVRLGQYDMIGTYIPTLSEFTVEYLSYVRNVVKKRSWRRDELSLRYLNVFFGDRKLSAIIPKDIQDYQSRRLKDGMRPATVNRELACLKHLFNTSIQRSKFFGDNPVSRVKFLEENNQVERVLSLDEERRLLDVCAPHLKPLVLTALNTGMRKGELISLRWENVDLNSGIITIEASNSKSKQLKRIPLNSRLRQILLEQRLKTYSTGSVFVTDTGKPYALRGDAAKRAFTAACRRASIEGLRFHDLRHTAATRMVEAGAGIVAVSRILGHADLKTTMRYAHPDDSLKDAVERLGNFNTNTPENRTSEKTEGV